MWETKPLAESPLKLCAGFAEQVLNLENVMVIDINSIKDHSSKFNSFSDLLACNQEGACGANYNVWFEVKQFRYSKNEVFTTKEMKEIFSPEEGVTGSSQLVTWDQIKQNLLTSFGYTANGVGSYSEDAKGYVVSQEEAAEKLEKFFKIVGTLIQFPPAVIYKYLPDDHGTFFNYYYTWGFCYVLLHQGEGLVIAAGNID